MKTARRVGFTLVEMLVVISIIGVLASLILPAVQSAREAGRRTVCVSRQEQLAKASQLYEGLTNEGRMVGFNNRLGGAGGRSWVIMLLPYMEQKAIYDNWRDGGNQVSFIGGLVCPSDYSKNAKTPAMLTYVVNAGRGDDFVGFVPDGVAHDFAGSGIAATASDFYDGRSSTLLFSENVQSLSWDTILNGGALKQNGVMVWFDAPNADRLINGNKKTTIFSLSADRARPASYHPGAVVATYADGHIRSLKDTIDYTVYQRLMTLNDSQSTLPAPVKALGPLSSSAYE